MSRNREPAEIIRLREAERALNAAQSAYNQRVRQGERQLRQAQKAHEKAIEDAKAELEGEKAAFAEPISSFEGAVLYKTRLEFEGSALKLDPALGCEIEVKGSLYAPGAGQEEKDTRAVDLHFRSPSGRLDVSAPYSKEKEARAFAGEVCDAAKNCLQAEEDYRKNVDLLSKGVEEAVADTHAVDMARSALAQDKNSTQSLEAAKERLEKARMQTPKEMLKSYKRGKAKKKLAAWGAALAAAIAIALLIIWACGGFR